MIHIHGSWKSLFPSLAVIRPVLYVYSIRKIEIFYERNEMESRPSEDSNYANHATREEAQYDSSRTFFLLRFDNLRTIVFDSERRKGPALPTTTDDPI